MGDSTVSFPSTARPEGRGGRERSADRAPRDFPGIRESVKDLLGKQMDALARQFAATHDMKVKDEINLLAKEYGKLDELSVFVAR